MGNPFIKIPFRKQGKFVFEPPSPVSSVIVECRDSPLSRGGLLRIGRKAGLLCDSTGRIRKAKVFIGNDFSVSQKAKIFRETVIFTFNRSEVEGATPEELSFLFEKSFENNAQIGQSLEVKENSRRNNYKGENKRKDKTEERKCRVLLFQNLFIDPDVGSSWENYFSAGSFQLASSLSSAGYDVEVISGHFIKGKIFSNEGKLLRVLKAYSPDLVCITLLEACIQETISLINFIKQNSPNVFVAVGGPMATIAPEHTACHLSGADFVARGDGEEIVCDIADYCSRIKEEGISVPLLEEMADLHGLIFFNSGVLVMCHPGEVNIIRDIDTSPFDVSFYRMKNLSGGISLETSRGCTHPCTFCITYSRGGFRGRSAKDIEMRLRAYRERLKEVFGSKIPFSSLRIHFPDDDFTHDVRRAIEILKTVKDLGFRVSSFQASIRDFFERESGSWKLNEIFRQSLEPDFFQDWGEFGYSFKGEPQGKRAKGFESFLKLGVESFCDEELKRLGKGYKTYHIEKVLEILDEKSIVCDAYFIFSNRKTTILNVVTSFLMIARLKIKHPHIFFIRFPIVSHLVTTYTSPAFRNYLTDLEKNGDGAGGIEIEKWLKVEGYPEYDYPVISKDIPHDPFVLKAAEKLKEIFEPDPYYLKPVENLRNFIIASLLEVEEKFGKLSIEASDGRISARRLDCAGKVIIYNGILMAREGKISKEYGRRFNEAARILGDPRGQVEQLSRLLEAGDPRLVLIPTRDCSLRCKYCPMIKEEGKLMEIETALMGVEMLLSSSKPSVILQFFGGEALLRKDFVLEIMENALKMAKRHQKRIGFILSTNGVSLDENLIEYLRKLPIKIEVSIDGTRDIHLKHRIGKDPSIDSYESIRRITPVLISSGIMLDAIMVTNPDTVSSLSKSFAHVAQLGYKRIQINPALGVMWSEENMREFAHQLYEIEKEFFSVTVRPNGLEFVDLWSYRTPVLLNAEITVDYDGSVYFGNGFLVKTSTKGAFYAGNLNDLEGFDACFMRRPSNEYFLKHTYPPEVTENNIKVGRILGSFVRHIRSRFPEEFKDKKVTTCPQPPGHNW